MSFLQQRLQLGVKILTFKLTKYLILSENVNFSLKFHVKMYSASHLSLPLPPYLEKKIKKIKAWVRYNEKSVEFPVKGHNCGFLPLIFPSEGYLESYTI